jgi:hypothetical protein
MGLPVVIPQSSALKMLWHEKNAQVNFMNGITCGDPSKLRFENAVA